MNVNFRVEIGVADKIVQVHNGNKHLIAYNDVFDEVKNLRERFGSFSKLIVEFLPENVPTVPVERR